MFLIKWLITGTIVYFLYKKFFALPPGKDTSSSPDQYEVPPKKDDDGDFIDYEEVD